MVILSHSVRPLSKASMTKLGSHDPVSHDLIINKK